MSVFSGEDMATIISNLMRIKSYFKKTFPIAYAKGTAAQLGQNYRTSS